MKPLVICPPVAFPLLSCRDERLLPRLATKGGMCNAGDGVCGDGNVGEKPEGVGFLRLPRRQTSSFIPFDQWGLRLVLVEEAPTGRVGIARLGVDR